MVCNNYILFMNMLIIYNVHNLLKTNYKKIQITAHDINEQKYIFNTFLADKKEES